MSATNIDWDLIKNLDPVQIKQNKDSKSIHAIIKSINSCFISSDQTIFSNNPLTPRLIQLLQVSIQYLMSFQKHLSNTIENKNKELATLQKKYKKMDQAYRQLLIINDNLRKPREVCPTCGKKFKIGYLDKHFQTRHPELIEPWTQIRIKSSNYNAKHDKAIIDEISAIQKAKEMKNKLEINKGNTVQISPNKDNAKDSKPHQQNNDEQISLSQGQLDQMVNEISKRVSERIQIEKNSNIDNVEPIKSSQRSQTQQTSQKSNSVPPQQLQQFAVDARRHDQSLNHQHYIQQNGQNEYTEPDYTRENQENPNISVNSLKKNSGNRVVFDPSVIENHCDSRRRNRSMNDANDYDDYDYNDEYNNEDNENYNNNYDNSPINDDKNRQFENSGNLNGQKDEISANELDDFIMGSSDVAISNQKSKPKQQKMPQIQQQQKNQPQSVQYNKNDNYQQNSGDYQNEFDEFMVDSSEIAASNHQNNAVQKSQPIKQQQPIKQAKQSQEDGYGKSNSLNRNNNDFQDEFDDYMIGSGEINKANFSQKPKQQIEQNQMQQQKQFSQSQQQQQKQQPPKQQLQNQAQTAQKPQQQFTQNQPPKQTAKQQQKQPAKPQQQQQLKQQPPKQQRSSQRQFNNSNYSQPSDSPIRNQGEFNDEFDDFMIDDAPPKQQKQQQKTVTVAASSSNRQTVIKGTPPQSRPIESSPASFPGSPAPSSSASFPASPTTPRPSRRSDHENSAFEFTEGSPRPAAETATSSSFRRSFNDEEAEEFKDFMLPPDELPKPPKRDIQGSYVAITNDELDDLIKESSSILDEEKSKNEPKKGKKVGQKRGPSNKQKAFTNSELNSMISKESSQKKANNYDDFHKGGQIPSQYANYTPAELDVIMAEESSAMDNNPPKGSYGNKSNYKNNYDDDYYYQDDHLDNNNYHDDYYDDIPKETNYNDDYYDDIPKETNYDNKYYNDDFNGDSRLDDNYSNQNLSNQDFKKDSFYEDEFKNQQNRQNIPEKIDRPPMSIAEARKMAKKKKKSQITTIGGVEFTDSQLAGFL